MSKISKYLHRRRKAILALAGTISTWAFTEFPDNHDVQVYGGLVAALVTGTIVHAVPNAKMEGE
jgi:phosphoribulokinase